MEDKVKRGDRVGERLRAELMALLMRGAVRDPAVQDTVVTAVRMSADLRNARVYVRLMEPSPSDARREALLRGLRRATSFIRRELSPRLALKYQPDLKFYWDDGLDEAARIESLLEGIRQEENSMEVHSGEKDELEQGGGADVGSIEGEGT